MSDTKQKSVEADTKANELIADIKNKKSIPVTAYNDEIDQIARAKILDSSEPERTEILARLDLLKNELKKSKETQPDDLGLALLMRTMEDEVKSVTTVEQIKTLLNKLDGLDADGKKIVLSFLVSKLALSGYITTVQNNEVHISHDTDKVLSTDFKTTLNAYIAANKVKISEIQRVIIVGTGSFGEFLDARDIDLKSVSTAQYAEFITQRRTIDLSKGNLDQKFAIINKSSATLSEKAFLISYVNGGFNNYNLAPDAIKQVELKKISQDFKISPELAKVSTAVDTASNGAVQKEKEAMAKSGKGGELTMESFMDNPASAISKYPWTSLALVIGGIWKFGFMKTIGGLLFGAIGIKAVNEIGGDSEIGKKMKKAFEDTKNEVLGKDKPNATTEAATPAAAANNSTNNSVDITKFSDFQKAGIISIQKNRSLTDDIANYSKQPGKEKQNADLEAYITTLHKDSIQNMTLDKLIYTTDHEQSIFSDAVKSQFGNDNKDIPDTMSRYLLKKTIRSYLGINESLSGSTANQKEGEKSREDFMKKFPADQWKDKPLKDLLNEIYKK